MTHFIKNGNTFTPANERDLDIHNLLPVGNYVVKAKPLSGTLYFDAIDSFLMPKKVYGIANRYADRIMKTFDDREVATGVLLTGEKGSGKSLLAKTLSARAAELGMPTVIVNAPFEGDSFNQLIQSIKQPAVVLFDEFEKVYDSRQQEAILTLLDGVFPSKKLFVLTCNDQWRIDANMRNRPGRIFYMLHYKGLDADFITEYCNDNLKDTSHTSNVCKAASVFAEFNFDMLKALVEEMNRFNESPFDALEMLNAKPSENDGSRFTISAQIDGIELDENKFDPTEWTGSPIAANKIDLSFNPELSVFRTNEKTVTTLQGSAQLNAICTEENCDDPDWTQVQIDHSDLKNIDSKNGVFTFAFNNVVVKFTRVRPQQFNFSKF